MWAHHWYYLMSNDPDLNQLYADQDPNFKWIQIWIQPFKWKRIRMQIWKCIWIHADLDQDPGSTYLIQRSGDIITYATRMLQFSSEMQQTWHTYYPRPQEQLLLQMFFYKCRPWTAHYRWKSPSFKSSTALRSKNISMATSVKLGYTLCNNFSLKGS
jgi:hypothetical protein